MEKLQAALARAREKREGDLPGGEQPRTGPKRTARAVARETAAAEALDQVWSAVPEADVSERRMLQSRIFANSAGQDAQAFDILRAKLLLEARRQGWTRIAITSATPGCGKTTIACNLIAGLIRQPEARGILFDFDLRRPSVGKFFGIKPKVSVSDVIEGKAAFDDQAVRIAPNAIVSAATGPMRDPAQLATRSSVAKVLDDIQARFRPDIMLFDLPPVLVSDETRVLLKLLDATLIIAQSEQSTLAQVDEAEREVAEYSRVAGIVLNKVRYQPTNYEYDY